jgi:hypothetical protein
MSVQAKTEFSKKCQYSESEFSKDYECHSGGGGSGGKNEDEGRKERTKAKEGRNERR